MHTFFLTLLSLLFFTSTLPAAPFVEEETLLIACPHGKDMFEWNLEFLKHASQSIEISACFLGGNVARKILTIIQERFDACPQLRAHILTVSALLEEADLEMIEFLKKRYPKRFFFVTSVNDFVLYPQFTSTDNHQKMMLIDGTYFSLGGTNLDDCMVTEGTYPIARNQKKGFVGTHLPAAHRDSDVVGRGPIVKELRREFFKHLALWENYHKYHKLDSDPNHFTDNRFFPIDTHLIPRIERFENSSRVIRGAKVRALFAGPYQPYNPITRAYEELISGAQKEIAIGNLYFNPRGKILEALMSAVGREIPLSITTNGLFTRSPYSCSLCIWISRIQYLPMFYARTFHFWEEGLVEKSPIYATHIYEYKVDDVLYHQKLMVIDRSTVLIGSYNFATRSHERDFEVALVIESPQLAENFLEVLELEKNYCKEITLEKARAWYFDPIVDFKARNQRKFDYFF